MDYFRRKSKILQTRTLQQMKNPSLTILLLGGGRRVSLAQLLKKSGIRLGYNIEIISYDISLEVPIAIEGKVIKGLRWGDENIIEDISKVIGKYSVNIILPIVNGAIEIASICKVRFPDVFVPVSDYKITNVLFDKIEAAKVFKESGFPIPKTYSVLSARMPAIAKPRKGGASRGIHIFTDMDDLMHLPNLKDYLVQEYLEHKDEFTVDCYIDTKGEIMVSVPRRRLEVMGGESTKTKTCRDEKLCEFSREVIKRFNLRGPVNLQFIHDLDSDRYLLMEVNPRISGAVSCSILAGAPICDYIILEALGREIEPCNDWKDGALLARYFQGTLFI